VQIDEPELVVSSIREVLGNGSSGPPRSFSLATIRTACIEFTEIKRGSNPEDIGDCRVSSFGTLGTIDNQTYYSALYCIVTNSRIGEGKCSGDSFNARYHRTRGLAVFSADTGAGVARILHERVTGDVGTMNYGEPEILRTAAGQLLYLPIRVDGTGNYNDSEYYLRKGGAWRKLDSESWQKDLISRLPAGRQIWKGMWPDLKTMRVEAGLYRKGDGNCCPTGGTARVRLAIRDTQFVITSAAIDTTRRR
jgi:hypothetical protein